MAWELINPNPFEDVEETRSEMDRFWDTFLFGVPQKRDFWEGTEWLPAVDVAETKNEIVVSVEAPGMNSKEFDIALKEGTLTIKGEKNQEKEEGEENYHLVERRYGTFTRSILLPQGVQSSKVRASYKGGILRVTLPKSREAKKKEVKVKVE